ncbi:hypothetical protein QQX98_001020 [Neonectria punicea]|uniref:Formylmethionine deformylase-like protein n=1 Tax=Neonectria punicea TaxID=979145 RepID=A0ABR1HRD4_9HYPO
MEQQRQHQQLPQHPATSADWRPTRDSSQPRNPSPPISPETEYTTHPTQPQPQFAFTEQPPQPPEPGFFASHSPQPPQPGFFAGYSNPASQHEYSALPPETQYNYNAYPPGPSSPGYFARPPADQNYGSSPAPWETFSQPTPSPGFLGSHHRQDSAADLLNPPREDAARPQEYSQTKLWQQQQQNAFFRFVEWWLSFWSQAWSMCCFLVAGILFAAGHHIFYEDLNGKEAENQPRMLRYGTALAFLAKANLVTAVILAFRQRAWMMVRRKILSLAAVDSLFAAAEDLSALFNWEAIKSAKLAMCLAVYIWATPLIVILTSETLSVTPQTKREHTHCPSVRTLNFTHEELNDWRKPISIENLYGLSLSLWNTTAEGEPDPSNPNSFDYWTASSQQSRQVALRTAYLQQAIMRKDAPEQICSVGWNCSLTIQFTGPGYKCDEVASGVRSEVKQLGNAMAPFSTSDLLPFGNYSYLAVTDLGEYAAQQIDSGHGGRPKQEPPYPKNLGAFRTEPIIWIGYADVDDRSKRQPQNRSVKGWYDAYTPTIFGCEHYETKYSVEFNYTGGIQAHKVKKREFLKKVVDTRYIPGQLDMDDGTWDNTTAMPESNFVYPQDIANYRRIGAYHSLGKLMRTILNGTIAMPYSISETMVTETRLIERVNYLPVKNFRKEIEEFYEEILLSLLSNPQFLAVSWASDPSKPSGVAVGGSETKYPCTRERTTNTFVYHRLELWSVYSIAILMATAGVVSGLFAVREEGVFRDNRFSSIVAATRGQSLNKVQWGAARDTKSLKVGFGMVPGYSGEKTPGFGLEGDVSQDRVVRSPAIQMMEWGEKATKRVKTATMRAQ